MTVNSIVVMRTAQKPAFEAASIKLSTITSRVDGPVLCLIPRGPGERMTVHGADPNLQIKKEVINQP